MNNSLEQIIKLLMYKGPSKNDIINNSNQGDYEFNIYQKNSLTILEVKSLLPFNKSLIDTYFYNSEDELIKQTITIGKQTKTVFDKYKEVKYLLKSPINYQIG